MLQCQHFIIPCFEGFTEQSNREIRVSKNIDRQIKICGNLINIKNNLIFQDFLINYKIIFKLSNK